MIIAAVRIVDDYGMLWKALPTEVCNFRQKALNGRVIKFLSLIRIVHLRGRSEDVDSFSFLCVGFCHFQSRNAIYPCENLIEEVIVACLIEIRGVLLHSCVGEVIPRLLLEPAQNLFVKMFNCKANCF